MAWHLPRTLPRSRTHRSYSLAFSTFSLRLLPPLFFSLLTLSLIVPATFPTYCFCPGHSLDSSATPLLPVSPQFEGSSCPLCCCCLSAVTFEVFFCVTSSAHTATNKERLLERSIWLCLVLQLERAAKEVASQAAGKMSWREAWQGSLYQSRQSSCKWRAVFTPFTGLLLWILGKCSPSGLRKNGCWLI